MLLLLSAYAAAIFHFASYSSSAAVDREASSSSLTKRQDGPHCNDKFGFPNYGDCEAAWAQIPVDDGIASLVFGPPATPGASVITPWFVSKGTCAIGVLNWPEANTPDRSAWHVISLVVRRILDNCLAVGKVGTGGYGLEFGVNKNLAIFVFQTRLLPADRLALKTIAESAYKCGWTTERTLELFQPVSQCAGVLPPAQCNGGSPSGRSVGYCADNGICCKGYGCALGKYTDAAITFGAAMIGNVGSCLPR